MDDDSITCDGELPGFRFHPTEEELLEFYLKNMLLGRRLHFEIIGILNIYHHDPWDLPGLAKIGEREWYFFVPRDRKHGNGGRPNRTTKKGFWKATGSDRKILSLSNPKKMIGLKKTLVFYTGRAPRGCKTDWIMNEYRLPDTDTTHNAMVLCKIYRKATSLRVLEQRAANDQEEIKAPTFHHDDAYSYSGGPSSSPPNPMDAFSICNHHNIQQHGQKSSAITSTNNVAMKKEDEEVSGWLLNQKYSEEEEDDEQAESNYKKTSCTSTSSLRLATPTKLAEIQVPKLNMDWTQDPFWTQLRSPWLDNLTPPYYYYANLLNF